MIASAVRRNRAARQAEELTYEHDVLKVKVRRLQEKDCDKVLEMLYDVQYKANAKSIAGDVVQGKLFLAFVAVIALSIYLYAESNLTMILANIWFFSAFIMAYLFTLKKVCKKFFHSGRDTTSTDEFYQYWTDKDHGHYMWVAEHTNGSVIGAVGVVDTTETSAEITRLAVCNDFQRRSVASQLMLALLDDCVKRNIEQVETSISYRQLPAQKMIKKFGFRTNASGFYEFGRRPFFNVLAAKYVLLLEKID